MAISRHQVIVIHVAVIVAALSMGLQGRAAVADAFGPQFFEKTIHPLIGEYCLKCHSTEKHKGDLDLQQFSSLPEVLHHPKIWQTVAEQLANNEMPPKDKPQPTPAQREQLSAWVNAVLDEMVLARAGDPGPVVLRRLSNAEYTYTIRDLTGLESLDPAREFPVDGAAGEGFRNTGNALVMSPSLLTKYLEAGKEIAKHAILLPDGIRFSIKTSPRDLTDETLARIREFYRQFTDSSGGDKVNLQGIVFETNEGGRLPVEKYIAATVELREGVKDGNETLEAVARKRRLSPKYLRTLWDVLNAEQPSFLFDGFRSRWRGAKPGDASTLADEIARWQKALWRFSSVGHIGKLNGPKAWMEPVSPLASKQDVRLKIPMSWGAKEVNLYLVASDAGDGNQNDSVIWQRPRLVAPGRQDILVRDIPALTRDLGQRREKIFADTTKALAAAAEASSATNKTDVDELARKHGIEPDTLRPWLEYLGIGAAGELKVENHFTNTIQSSSGFDFIKGWGSPETPLLLANSSDQHVRIPGNMKPHSVAVHPSPKLQAAIGWRSPIAGIFRIDAKIVHAHPECGNGITWILELRRGPTRQRLAGGTAQGAKEVAVGPIENLAIQPGDFVSVLIGPREGNHACDLTEVNLTLDATGQNARRWDLARDISPDVLAGNPHADAFGNEGVWHFYTEPDKPGSDTGPIIPANSLLAMWQASSTREEKQKLAEDLQEILMKGPSITTNASDIKLYRQLSSLSGPMFSAMLRRPDLGSSSDTADLRVHAPEVLEMHLPADLAAGCEFVTTGILDPETGREGSVQLQVLTNRPDSQPGLLASKVTVTAANGLWTSDNRRLSLAAPILVTESSAARLRIESGFEEFRRIFPAALCYTKIVPVDEVVTLTLFYREDDQLARLMLDDSQKGKLDRLWDELHYISHDALTLVDAFEQLWQFATQDADPKVFEPLRVPIKERAARFRQRLLDTEPKHLDAVLEFAGRAYRRPLSEEEAHELRGLYHKLREQDVPHEDAIRLTLARVLVASAFLYRLEKAAPGADPAPVSNWELASRLSYFLWSSTPDDTLRAAAAAGTLRQPEVLVAQARRMLRDARTRRLATEFACQWLHIQDFDTLDEKSERHFPTFASLRTDMYEESIRFFSDLFQRDGSVLELLDADYTFLNEPLAKFYGIPGVSGPEWRRVDGIKRFSRGGILGLSATLAKQSGASRTSPILRGNWVAEALLGDKLPRPPKDVPRLPDDEAATEGLTVRQLVEKHSSDSRCATCHVRMDPYGFALESFDAIGRHREKDLADRPIETHARVTDGSEFDGIDGLRQYLLTQRRDAFLRQFCRKLLGYSLGRAVQLSDGPLLTEMAKQLKVNDYRMSVAVETVVRSRQFREIRGRDGIYED